MPLFLPNCWNQNYSDTNPGAFSGASKNGKPGKFELANHGTILLDEIGEMPQTLQSKLLRVLQEQEFERIGGINTIKVNVRIIAVQTRICNS